jgi:putative transposase
MDKMAYYFFKCMVFISMLKAYKYRITPNALQRNLFARHFGCSRWVYNWALEKKQAFYKETGQSLSRRALQDELVLLKKQTDTYWLNEVNSQTLLASLGNLDVAYKNFFQKRANLPQFKSKYDGHQSYQCPQHVQVQFEQQVIDLPKIKHVKAIIHRKFEGKIKTCTISRTPTHKYFISVLVETPDNEPILSVIEPDKTVGIDLGIKDFLITSEGQKHPNHRFLKRNLKRLKRLQRKLSKKEERSSNRAKVRKKLARLHEKIRNQRLDMIHQASAKLVYKNFDTSFAIEDLNIKGMLKNHKLAGAIGDCGWRLFLNALSYKSKWSGKNVLTIERWAPSSKTCSQNGTYKKDLTLSERIYSCDECGIEFDRDINAALNIRKFALVQIGREPSESKPWDHALTGNVVYSSYHDMKKEADTIALA